MSEFIIDSSAGSNFIIATATPAEFVIGTAPSVNFILDANNYGPPGADGAPGPSDHTLLSNIGTNTHVQIDTHLANTSNPHSVTKTQVGLGNVDNTSDASKPVSTATQTALNAKANTTHNHAAGDINSGTMATARLGSGTADSTTFLRGDQTWAVPSGGGGGGGVAESLIIAYAVAL